MLRLLTGLLLMFVLILPTVHARAETAPRLNDDFAEAVRQLETLMRQIGAPPRHASKDQTRTSYFASNRDGCRFVVQVRFVLGAYEQAILQLACPGQPPLTADLDPRRWELTLAPASSETREVRFTARARENPSLQLNVRLRRAPTGLAEVELAPPSRLPTLCAGLLADPHVADETFDHIY